MEERDAWICLGGTSGVGEITFWPLIARHGGALAALRAVQKDPSSCLPEVRLARPIRDALSAAAADPLAVSRRVADLGLWTLTPLDPGYPQRLRVLDPPPAVLFGAGDPACLMGKRVVAVVGTRRPTAAGRSFTSRVCVRLVELGAVVVSGMAFGVDGAAHSATMAAGGRTVAVIGGGHARAGPRAHGALMAQMISSGGAVVAEHGPDALPTKGTFPRRNRIISALAEATIVIEAPMRSGALITAHHALEQGRTVLVAPGRPEDPHVRGSLALLRETPARPLVGLDELIVDLGYDDSGPEPSESSTTAKQGLSLRAALDLLGPAERAVAERLTQGPSDADGLVTGTGLSPQVVSGALTLLQLRGWAQVMGAAYLAAGPLLAVDRR